MQRSQFGRIAMRASGWYFEVALGPRQVHHGFEIKFGVIGQAGQGVGAGVLVAGAD